MRTVRCKTWDSFTVTPNRRRHHAVSRPTRINAAFPQREGN
jgi:hypothetical protein